ncbi:MAG TPA: hypothetical protein VFB75_18625, partial [Burkholderiales bacterium]|nr:hypothetical protein [Burkholderiales bacterium]
KLDLAFRIPRSELQVDNIAIGRRHRIHGKVSLSDNAFVCSRLAEGFALEDRRAFGDFDTNKSRL